MKMIRFCGVAAAGFALVLAAAPLAAQSVAEVGGPAEQPPAGFSGQQYVDSRGCVFMRAGFSGRTNWVPRIGRDRKAMCGEVTPAQASQRLAAGDSTALVQGAGNLDPGAPMETVASALLSGKMTGTFAPAAVPGLVAAPAARQVQPQVVAPAPRAVAQQALPAAIAPSAGGASVGCPAQAPVLQRLPLSTGGTVAVCTRGDGGATGWFSPTYATGARPGAAINGTHADQLGMNGGVSGGMVGGTGYGGQISSGQVAAAPAPRGSGGYVQTVIAGQAVVAPRREVPRYVAAWQDDRLNPNRGLGTARGWAAQAQVWTNTTPAKGATTVQTYRGQAAFGQVRVTGSTMSAAPARASQSASGRLYVQVGTFGQAANAQNAAGRLAGLGLPVASAKGSKGGRALVAIMAGPFGSSAEAQQALNAARGAGFGDAFIR